MRETFGLVVATAIAITFTTTLTAAIAASPSQGKTVEGGCYHGAGWSGGPHWLKSKGGGVASYMSCSSGTSHFDFECQPGSPEITFSIGSLGEPGPAGSALNMHLSVGNKTFKFPSKVANNQAWNDQRPTLHLPRNHELLNALMSGTSGQVRVGRHSFKFYLKGARGPIEAMLAACPGIEPTNHNARADTQTDIGRRVAIPNSAAKARGASPQTFNGPCVRGYTWFGQGPAKGQEANGGGATYQGCGDGEYAFSFSCRPQSKRITLDIEIGMPGAADKKPVIVPVIVGARRFELKGTASFNEMAGGATPSVTFDRDNGMLDALMSGNSARMLLGKKSFRFHLNGSRKAFDVMLAACPPPSP